MLMSCYATFQLKKNDTCTEQETIGTTTTTKLTDLLILGFSLSKGNSILLSNPASPSKL